MAGETTDQVSVQAAVDSLADTIISQLDEKPEPTPQPEPEPERKPEPETKPDTEKAPEPPPVAKEKIKWQGQEIEMPLDEIKNLAQQGYDYTRKMQDLKASVAPLEGLKKHIDSDPAFAAHIAGYFQKQIPKEEPTPKFDDPIDQLKYEVRQETLREVEEKFLRPVQEQQRQMTHQQVINTVRQQVMADPLYQDVQKAIIDHVQALPPAIQRTAMLQLDQDPKSYLDTFNHFREKIASTKSTEKKPPEEMPKPKSQTEHAPILEAAGSVQPETTHAERRAKIAKMKQKALSSGDPQVMADYLLASGRIDHLIPS